MRLAISFLLALVCLRGDTLNEILARMDADALKFKGVTAKLTQIEYIPSIRETEKKEGSLTLLKIKSGVAALLDYTSPDASQWLLRDRLAQQFLPKLNLIQEYDLGKYSSVVNEFLTLGFGASGKDLQKNYKVQDRGGDLLKVLDKEVKATKLELVPRSPEGLKYMSRIEFWVPEGSSYAVQLKVHQPNGTTNTAIYSSVQLNPAGLNDHSVELQVPKNVKREKINK